MAWSVMMVAGLELQRTTLTPASFKHPAGLGAGVVELRRLADDDGAGADDQHLLNALIQRHYRSPPFIRSTNWSNRNDVSLGPVQASGWNWTVKARRSG